MDIIYPDEWNTLAQSIVDYRSIMILGGVDTGKSTFIRFLAGDILRRGKTVALVNTDVGQSDIGPPTTMGVAIPNSPFAAYEDLKTENLYFVGTNSPAGNCIICLVGVHRMIECAKSRKPDAIIVNTTGWIYGSEACDYKIAKINMLNPDLIIAFQPEKELSTIVKPFKMTARPYLCFLPVSSQVRQKTPEERRRLRVEKYKRYFNNSSLHLVSWRNIAILGANNEDFRHRELSGRLVGLFDRNNECRGIGILRSIELEETRLLIQAHSEAMKELTQVHIGYSSIEED